MRPNHRSVSLLQSAVLLALSLCVQVAFAEDDDNSPSAEEREAVRQLAAAGASLLIDGEFQVVSVQYGLSSRSSESRRESSAAPAFDVALLAKLPHVKTLVIYGSSFNDDDVPKLGELKSLTRLSMRSTRITSAGLDSLKKLLPDCQIDNTVFGRTTSSSTRGSSSRGGFTSSPFGSGRTGTSRTSSTRNPSSSLLGQIEQEVTQAELELNDDQLRSIAMILEKFGSYTAMFQDVINQSRISRGNNSSPDSETRSRTANTLRQRIEDRNRDAEQELAKVLSADQLTRLKQLTLQVQRTPLFVASNSEAAKTLKLSGEQSQKIAELSRQRNRFPSRNADGTVTSSRLPSAQIDEQILAVLTDEQKLEWQKLLGPPRKITGSAPIPPEGEIRGSRLERSARFGFFLLDDDHDGTLTDAEWQTSSSTRRAFENAQVELKLPMSIDDFSLQYVKLIAKSRAVAEQRASERQTPSTIPSRSQRPATDQ
ncbi:hypothetical protein GC176_10020 [bacterium]|nr:hypothetical protein [bacterium]